MPIGLAIDTSSEVTFVALSSNGSVLEKKTASSGTSHSEELSPIVAELLAEAGISLREIDFIVYGKGPGSFTGLRIGVSYLQGLNFALRKPIAGVCSLQAAAFEFAAETSPVISLKKASRDTLYVGVYRQQQGRFCALRDPSVVRTSELESLKSEYGNGAIWVGPSIGEEFKSPQHIARSLLNLAPREQVNKAITAADISELPLSYIAPINAKTIAERAAREY